MDSGNITIPPFGDFENMDISYDNTEMYDTRGGGPMGGGAMPHKTGVRLSEDMNQLLSASPLLSPRESIAGRVKDITLVEEGGGEGGGEEEKEKDQEVETLTSILEGRRERRVTKGSVLSRMGEGEEEVFVQAEVNKANRNRKKFAVLVSVTK